MMRMQVLREICPKVPEKSRASHGKAKCPDGEVQETKRKRRSSGENRRFLFGVPEGIRTPDLTLRSTFYTFFANAVWPLTTLQTRINTDFFSEHNVFSSLLFLLILRDDSNSN